MVEHSEAASRFDNLVVLDHGSKLERHVPVAKTLSPRLHRPLEQKYALWTGIIFCLDGHRRSSQTCFVRYYFRVLQ